MRTNFNFNFRGFLSGYLIIRAIVTTGYVELCAPFGGMKNLLQTIQQASERGVADYGGISVHDANSGKVNKQARENVKDKSRLARFRHIRIFDLRIISFRVHSPDS